MFVLQLVLYPNVEVSNGNIMMGLNAFVFTHGCHVGAYL